MLLGHKTTTNNKQTQYQILTFVCVPVGGGGQLLNKLILLELSLIIAVAPPRYIPIHQNHDFISYSVTLIWEWPSGIRQVTTKNRVRRDILPTSGHGSTPGSSFSFIVSLRNQRKAIRKNCRHCIYFWLTANCFPFLHVSDNTVDRS